MSLERRIANLRLVMIGSLPPPLGGTTVSFSALSEFAAARVGSCRVIDTGSRAGGNLGAAARGIVGLVRELPRADVVSMHFSDRAAITIAPILASLCLAAGKPFVFRQFGGEFDRTFAQLPEWRRAILRRTIFAADAVLLQTKSMVKAFDGLADRLFWFPTARPRSAATYQGAFAKGGSKSLRCLFMGHVSRAKGAERAARAVAEIAGAELSIYGPLVDLAAQDLEGPATTYRGIALPGEVAAVMAEHDLLLFPTMHSGEGYSGTLVEAAMVGLPIVASRWQSLPEMFADDEVLFVPPDDLDALAGAIKSIMESPDELTRRSTRLIARSSAFDAETVFGRFLEICADTVRRGDG
jgi:glycosyltransferase involved in cell wall biosynthesis